MTRYLLAAALFGISAAAFAGAAYAAPCHYYDGYPFCDYSTTVPAQTPIDVTAGATPPDGFVVSAPVPIGSLYSCTVEDDTANAGMPSETVGFPFGGLLSNGSGSLIYATPPAYRPMGPLYVYCPLTTRIEVRTW